MAATDLDSKLPDVSRSCARPRSKLFYIRTSSSQIELFFFSVNQLSDPFEWLGLSNTRSQTGVMI